MDFPSRAERRAGKMKLSARASLIRHYLKYPFISRVTQSAVACHPGRAERGGPQVATRCRSRRARGREAGPRGGALAPDSDPRPAGGSAFLLTGGPDATTLPSSWRRDPQPQGQDASRWRPSAHLLRLSPAAAHAGLGEAAHSGPRVQVDFWKLTPAPPAGGVPGMRARARGGRPRDPSPLRVPMGPRPAERAHPWAKRPLAPALPSSAESEAPGGRAACTRARGGAGTPLSLLGRWGPPSPQPGGLEDATPPPAAPAAPRSARAPQPPAGHPVRARGVPPRVRPSAPGARAPPPCALPARAPWAGGDGDAAPGFALLASRAALPAAPTPVTRRRRPRREDRGGRPGEAASGRREPERHARLCRLPAARDPRARPGPGRSPQGAAQVRAAPARGSCSRPARRSLREAGIGGRAGRCGQERRR